ncbi:MAG: class I SAM-dependent methyltransferase [Tissierellia bacterium]|nr:class I SAM-dependent methyltransferase [Tissierellia bacterium]MDD4780778.1 class I SAM-dependent methyltransferase [Tissierellia bacterium]
MNRLETIKSMVTKCHTVADIGTDHGYVAEMLLNDNIAEKIIATDLNKGPLNRAIEYLTSKNLSDKCDFRLGSGLTVLEKNEADAIIIAGMGGDLISDILHTSKNIAITTKQLIIQPMTAIDKLRKYLYNNGYKIIDESIVKEFHHYYFIMNIEPGYEVIEDEIYYEISKHLILKKDPIMYKYIDKIIDTNNKIIQSLEKSDNLKYKIKINDLINKNNKIMEILKYEA